MTAIVHTEREQWLRRRRELVTASDVGAILGIDPRRGPLAVYASKVGELDEEETRWMSFGRGVEGAIADWYAADTGRPAVDLGAYEIQTHPDASWLGATLDRLTSGSPQHPGLAAGNAPLECKAVAGMKAAQWREEPPLHFQVQAAIQMACTATTWASLVALIGGVVLTWKDIARDDNFLAAALPRLEAFHIRVQRREPPEETDGLATTSRAVRALFPGNGETVPLEPEVLATVSEWERAKRQKNEAEREADEIENRLRRLLAGATFGALIDGSFLKLRKTHRNGYTVAATDYTVLDRFWPRIRRREA